MKFKVFFIAIMLTTVISFIGCDKQTKPTALQEKPTVAVTIVPQATFVQKVAGDLVNIVTLVPPGYSPANYQPAPKLMEQLSNASIYFTIGVPTENSNILPRIGSFNANIKVVDLAGEVGSFYPHRYFELLDEHTNKTEYSHGHDHKHEGHDPHIWLSPKRVKVMIDIIAQKLSALDTKNEEVYKRNASLYKSELDRVDSEIKDTLKSVKNKSFIIYHPSLGYFADDYGLTMYPIEAHGKEATPQNLQMLVDIAVKENIKVVFYQSEIDSRQSRTFAEEIGGKAVMIEPLSGDYINNLKKVAEVFINVLGD